MTYTPLDEAWAAFEASAPFDLKVGTWPDTAERWAAFPSNQHGYVLIRLDPQLIAAWLRAVPYFRFVLTHDAAIADLAANDQVHFDYDWPKNDPRFIGLQAWLAVNGELL